MQGNFIYGKGFSAVVLTCPAFGSYSAGTVQTSFGQCPNGDALHAGTCAIPSDVAKTTTAVFNSSSTVSAALNERPACAGSYGITTAASLAANALSTHVSLVCSDGGSSHTDVAGNRTCAAQTATTSTACGTGGTCVVPTAFTPANSGCLANAGAPDGRVYNEQLYNGSVTAPAYAQYTVPAIGSVQTFSMAAAYNRIHQYETLLGASAGVGLASGCQYQDMTDQIGCLAQADPCSIGYAGDAAKADVGGAGVANGASGPSNGPLGAFDSARVAQVYPGTTTVQLLGLGGEYQLSRKLYFNSLVGFAQLPNAAFADNGTDELQIAKFEAQTTGVAANTTAMQNIVTNQKEFLLGFQSGALTGTAGAPFCEDFNEQLICNDVAAAAANVNGCTLNGPGAGLAAAANTVCGDGIRGPYEECDNGTVAAPANGHATGNSGTDLSAGGCSTTCRCNNDFVTSTTAVTCSDGSAGGQTTCNTSLTTNGFAATLGVACGTAVGAECVAVGACD